jgi:UDP-glucose 4-epimerase
MNILVTGGCGLIGSNLVTALKKLDHNVITVDINESADYVLDISMDDLLQIEEPIDVIYHLAAQPYGRGSEIDPSMDLEFNIRGTMRICYLAEYKQVKHIVYTSTMAVYGNNDNASEIDKLDPLSNYAVSKLSAEYYLKKFAQQYNFTYSILRLWNTYGPGQDLSNEYKGVVSAFANQVINSNTINVTGSLDRYRDIIYVDDVVNALLLMLSVNYSDTFNVSTGIKTTIKELIHALIKANGNELIDYDIVDIGGHPGDQFGCIGNSDKLKNLGWNPETTLEIGINKFLTYIKEQNAK